MEIKWLLLIHSLKKNPPIKIPRSTPAMYGACEQGGNIKCVNRVAIYRACEHGCNIECEQGAI